MIESLKNIIEDVDFVNRHRLFPKSFIRKRCLTFKIMILILMNMLKGSIQDELDHFFKALHQTPICERVVTKSAFTQARKNLDPMAFVELNDHLVRDFYNTFPVRTWMGSIVDGVFVSADSEMLEPLPPPPVYLKAQIPGSKNRAAHGLVRRIDTADQLKPGLKELLAPGDWGQAEGVLITSALTLAGEYYAACMVDIGHAGKLPGGVLLFSDQGGSGVEERSEKLQEIYFSLLNPPTADALSDSLQNVMDPKLTASFLEKMIQAFIRYRLIVLEINPIGVLQDGSLVAVDCRCEFEKHAVQKEDKNLFVITATAKEEQTRLEQVVEKINEMEPAGTGFVRENREPIPENAFRVATNLCGGGGKMLWELAAGSRQDIYSLNESDTSGGLSAFKSYRILRAILDLEKAQVLLLTGSGMAFQNQYHLAAAVWKALRESPGPLPMLLRFGGTDEEPARQLIHKVASTLPVSVKTFLPHIFPNAMIDEIPDMALQDRISLKPERPPSGPPTFTVAMPPGEFFYFPDKWPHHHAPPCVGICPARFLSWNDRKRTVEPIENARCIGCLLCETISLLEGSGELRIKLDMPEVR